MFARNVSFRLKSDMLSDYTRTFEKEIIPLLRKQKGFKDEITLSNPGSLDAIAISLWESSTDAASHSTSPQVAIANERFAHTYLGTTDPIGKTFMVRQDGGKPDRIYHIVALVGDTRYRDIHDEPTPIISFLLTRCPMLARTPHFLCAPMKRRRL